MQKVMLNNNTILYGVASIVGNLLAAKLLSINPMKLSLVSILMRKYMFNFKNQLSTEVGKLTIVSKY